MVVQLDRGGGDAVGVVALGGGAMFGLRARDKDADADAVCPSTMCTDPEAVRLSSEAGSAATPTNVLFISGGAAIAGGLVLWLLGAPPRSFGELARKAPRVDATTVGLSLSGAF